MDISLTHLLMFSVSDIAVLICFICREICQVLVHIMKHLLLYLLVYVYDSRIFDLIIITIPESN